MYAGRGLLGDAAPVLNHVPVFRILGVDLLEQILNDLLFVAAGRLLTQSSPFSSS